MPNLFEMLGGAGKTVGRGLLGAAIGAGGGNVQDVYRFKDEQRMSQQREAMNRLLMDQLRGNMNWDKLQRGRMQEYTWPQEEVEDEREREKEQFEMELMELNIALASAKTEEFLAAAPERKQQIGLEIKELEGKIKETEARVQLYQAQTQKAMTPPDDKAGLKNLAEEARQMYVARLGELLQGAPEKGIQPVPMEEALTTVHREIGAQYPMFRNNLQAVVSSGGEISDEDLEKLKPSPTEDAKSELQRMLLEGNDVIEAAPQAPFPLGILQNLGQAGQKVPGQVLGALNPQLNLQELLKRQMRPPMQQFPTYGAAGMTPPTPKYPMR